MSPPFNVKDRTIISSRTNAVYHTHISRGMRVNRRLCVTFLKTSSLVETSSYLALKKSLRPLR